MWWLALHALAACSVAALDRGLFVTAAGFVLLVAHAGWRRPPPPPEVRRLANGRWVVPAASFAAAALGSGTRCHAWWVRLELVQGGQRVAVLLLRDQLDREPWRRLQADLRRSAFGSPDERPVDFR